MTQEEYTLDLYKWLNEFDIIDRLLEYTRYKTYQPLNHILDLSILSLAFEWVKTPEGYGYWHDIVDQYPSKFRHNEFTLGKILNNIKILHNNIQSNYEYW